MKKPEILKQQALEFFANLPSWAVLLRVHRQWRQRKFISWIKPEEVMTRVIEDGRMTSRYSFMVTMSCAIAILGLLLSSPAVIIGAMLISPLMGPIMSLGFSLCIIDLRQMKKALEAIGIGFLLSLAISGLIVAISPLTDPTPEIMARTQPNLFDLLVAIFSGLAGGYATIKQKGETIVGVAIATALMPPLAVVGYGMATGSWTIAQGAFFLFMTNLLAISLSVTLMAKWYGFGAHNSSKYTLWQTALVFGVFATLSVPLGFSLSKIAYQSYITKTAKAEIQSYFADASSRIANFSIAFKTNEGVHVDCIMVTDVYAPEAEKDLQEKLAKSLRRNVNLSLDQIVVARHDQEKVVQEQEKLPDTALSNPMQARMTLLTTQEEMAQTIKNSVFFPLQFVKVDAGNSAVAIYPKQSKGVNLAVLHSVEEKLRSRFPDWSVFVVPPVQALPFVFFDIGKDRMSTLEAEKVKDTIWAIRRWDVPEVAVIGYASTIGEFERFDNTSLAYRRANAVAQALAQENIKVVTRAEYRSFKQKREELNYGINSLQRVEIRLVRPPDVADGSGGVPVLPSGASGDESVPESSAPGSAPAPLETEPAEDGPPPEQPGKTPGSAPQDAFRVND